MAQQPTALCTSVLLLAFLCLHSGANQADDFQHFYDTYLQDEAERAEEEEKDNTEMATYYFPMLRDKVRNSSFRKAIEKIDYQSKLVLDIGAGQV